MFRISSTTMTVWFFSPVRESERHGGLFAEKGSLGNPWFSLGSMGIAKVVYVVL